MLQHAIFKTLLEKKGRKEAINSKFVFPRKQS